MANVVSITNPVFATADGTAIDCVLQVDAFPDPVPFTASVNDVEAHGRKIYVDLIACVYGDIAAYAEPAPMVI
jgi:hypothetical protein